MSFFTGNLAVLQKKHQALFQAVASSSAVSGRLETLDTKSGGKTVRAAVCEYGREKKLLIHSSFDPCAEGARFAAEQMKKQRRINFLYGFGLGYHVQNMAALLEPGNKLVVFDTSLDIFCEALKLRNLEDVFNNSQIELFISNDLNYMAANVARVLESGPDLHVMFHGPSLIAMEESFDELKFILQEINLRKSISQEYIDLLHANYLKNRQILKRNVGDFFGRFKNLPIIIVSAGPSLDKNKRLLKGLGNKALLICVAHALKGLIKMNVKPHFIITIDPQPITLKQIEGFEHLDIPFILMATAWPENAEIYQGPKFIACQHRDYLNPGEENYLIKTGGSVSTAALDIAIRLGGNPIVLIGQDLAFSYDKHHCEDSYQGNDSIKPLDTMRKVQGWNNTKVPTTLGLLSFKRWMQSRIRDENNIIFINSTEGGALIEGFRHIPLCDVIAKYMTQDYNINEMINRVTVHQ